MIYCGLKMDEPRTLRDSRARERRLKLLSLAHDEPLTSYVHELRDRGFGEVPYFDPLDGGIKAEALFLFEKPGPQAAGSGFISRNNDDPTAENTFVSCSTRAFLAREPAPGILFRAGTEHGASLSLSWSKA
jgi:hypothetical protein